MTVAAHHHCLLNKVWGEVTQLLVMYNYILRHTFQALLISKNYLHLAHVILTLVYILRRCAFSLTFLIIFLNFLGLF